MKNLTRRGFLYLLFVLSLTLSFLGVRSLRSSSVTRKRKNAPSEGARNAALDFFGVDEDGLSSVYLARGGTPEENTRNVINLMGGIDAFVGPKDIVVLKPNAQWWNQGMTNTDSMKSFIEMVLEIPGFSGEIIIAENHQYDASNSRGWTTNKRNGSFNYNELVEYFQRRGFPNVTKYHWQCAGRNVRPIEGDGCCGRRVKGPEEGDGYVWRDDIVYTAPNGNVCWMTYPVFTSRFSGITIDLKEGAWKDGTYLEDRQVRLINFSALNHHSAYAGVTASIKNLMGVVDMTCGFQNADPPGTYNVHFVGIKKYVRYTKKLHWRLDSLKHYLNLLASSEFHYSGGALGTFMRHIRFPALNIITAEWVGWGSRTDTQRSFRPRAVLASRDPVALDYLAAKEVLLPVTPKEMRKYRQLNNPDLRDMPFYRFLRECHLQGIGNLDARRMRLVSA